MDEHDRPAEGCLVAVVRIPARILAFAVVVPVRFVWELLVLAWRAASRALASAGRAVHSYLIAPVGRALGWTGKALYAYLLTPVGRAVAAVLRVLWRGLVAVGRAVAWTVRQLDAYVLRPFARGVAWCLTAAGRAIGWLVGTLLLRPLLWFGTRVLAPVGRALLAALVATGHGLVRGGRALAAAARWLGATLLVRPGGWVGRRVLRPSGRGLVVALFALGAALVAGGRGLLWLGRNGVLLPLAWLLYWGLLVPLEWFGKSVLAPLGRALWAGLVLSARGVRAGLVLLGRAVAWTGRTLVAAPLRWLLRSVLTPIWHGLVEVLAACLRGLVRLLRGLLTVLNALGRALGVLLRYLLVIPLGWLWRVLLSPVLRTVGQLLGQAWRLAGRLWRFAVLRPCRWVRQEVWWPVKDELRRAWSSVREAAREARRALVGGTGRTLDADRSPAGAHHASGRPDPLTKD
ncbi:hypothetical protein [Kitasatospora sp. NPDC004289]